MADTRNARPVAPHLQVWRWTLPLALSIIHRMTGGALYLGTALLVWWLVAAAIGPDQFETARTVFSSWLGILVLFGFSWALIQHLLGGLRHLMWDTGRGLDLPTVFASGWVVAVGAAVLTVLLWIIGLVVT
ncbi:MAG TPA: succinate dehydrogenase, cytochrome b556 subunit [Aestuariivirgaceae bacterium]|nr:succinate dehydrogenase, cytochrome b556 subunit [Aestuariivirgaceae bacterium]